MEILPTLLKVYGTISIISAGLMVIWIGYISVKATDILVRGHICQVKYGPTFEPKDIMKIHDYFCLYRGFGMIFVTLLAWPYIVYVLIKTPRDFYMIEEIEAHTDD